MKTIFTKADLKTGKRLEDIVGELVKVRVNPKYFHEIVRYIPYSHGDPIDRWSIFEARECCDGWFLYGKVFHKKVFDMVEEETEMSRLCITDKGSGMQPPKSEWFGHTAKVEPQAKKDFVVGKWYKCLRGEDLSTSKDLKSGKWYNVVCTNLEDDDEYILIFESKRRGNQEWFKSRFDINSESDYDPDAKINVAKDVGESKLDNIVQVTIVRSTDTNNFMSSFLTTKEDINIMSNQNRVVSVKFFDDDAGLKAEHSLVAEYQVTTRVSDQMTISKVLLTEDVAGDIELHNGIRANTVDLHILKQTGNKVMLQPVEFEDLRVEVRQV